jgi:lipoprotein signal peptidase
LSVKSVWSRWSVFTIGFVIIALDQWTKAWVRYNLPPGMSWNPVPWLEPIVTLTHTQNTGVAFGLFKNLGGVFVVVALAVIVTGSWLRIRGCCG